MMSEANASLILIFVITAIFVLHNHDDHPSHVIDAQIYEFTPHLEIKHQWQLEYY